MMNKQTIFLLLTITSLTACGSGVYLSVRGDHASNVIVFMDDKKEGTIPLVTSTNSGFFGTIYFTTWSGPRIMKLYAENRKPIELQVNLKKQRSYYLHYDVDRDEFDWEGTKYSVPPGSVIRIQDIN